jgi:hypothetical protein
MQGALLSHLHPEYQYPINHDCEIHPNFLLVVGSADSAVNILNNSLVVPSISVALYIIV